MNAKVRWMIDLGSIYIKGELWKGKFPLGLQQNPQQLDPHHVVECGGTKSHKNLIKERPLGS